MVTTHSLKAGESLTVNGTVTVLRCGTHTEGGEPSVQVVDLEVEDAPEVAPPAADPAEEPAADSHETEEPAAAAPAPRPKQKKPASN
jgi:hypothetical protein